VPFGDDDSCVEQSVARPAPGTFDCLRWHGSEAT
jgi:hypothetical protein